MADKNFKTSCQLAAAIRPIKKDTAKHTPIPSFLTIRSFRLIDWPIRASGIANIQGIFERIATRKFVRRNAAANKPVVRPRTIFALSDLVKISVKPTSENHHQSVTRPTMLEKKMKNAITIPKNAQENIFVIQGDVKLYLLYHKVM